MGYYGYSGGTSATIEVEPDGTLTYISDYNRNLVSELKSAIPYSDRRWDAREKVWRVAGRHLDTLKRLTKDWLGTNATVIEAANLGSQGVKIETVILKVEYIGQAKERADGSVTATGFADNDWRVIFPEQVLKDWFDGGFTPPASAKEQKRSTLFATLGVKPESTPAEIKSAYRKAAKTWHPDINKDPDAPEMFMLIQSAYETLSDPVKLKKYKAGLAFEKSLTKNAPKSFFNGHNTHKSFVRASAYGVSYKPPIRCGYVAVEASKELGRYKVRKILEWQDIKNERGESMVSYWPKGAQNFVTDWV